MPAKRTHGDSRTPLYGVWQNMRQRCSDVNDERFARYGARGIKVCAEWSDYATFKVWAEANGFISNRGLSIERINNNGDYTPDNCRWATPSEQARNRRTSHVLEAFGESKTLIAWAEDTRCRTDYSNLQRRINQLGWPSERAIITPTRAKRKAQA